MRTSRAAALATAIILVAGAAGWYAVAHRHHAVVAQPAAASTPGAVPTPTAPRDPVLAPLDGAAARPLPAAVATQLRSAARAAGRNATLAGEVLDVKTGDRLWADHNLSPEPPASTTKLLTAAAALRVLGPDDRLTTTTRRVGGTVYLVGGGDPTIVRDAASPVDPAYPRPATMADLARRTAAALGHTHRVRLRLDASSWTGPRAAPGWKPGYVTEGDVTPPSALEIDEGRITSPGGEQRRTKRPIAQAGSVFAALLEQDGVDVVGHPAAGTAPRHARSLAGVRSPTVATLVQRMLTVSDDDLAEALGRAVARREHLPASFSGAARAVTHAVAALGVPTRGVRLHDTSGLSHQDRVTPRALVGVLRTALSPGHEQLRPLVAGLPVAGFTGTLSGRYLGKPDQEAAGVVRAKTGTLTGVNALAGMAVDRSGRLLVFAFLASHAKLPGLTVPALDRLATRLARCGCAT